ncbi:MAG TPA: hypothetical protein VFX12_08190 [Vicinamibacterales bacterium]|nr:hypothetical protein [Vicinamibacterales bacterium]
MTQLTRTGTSTGSAEPSGGAFLQVSGRQRPHTALWEDAVTMLIGIYALLGLFFDGWRHNNLTGIDTFWSAAHIMIYTGILGLGVWIAIVLARHQTSLLHLDWSAVPYGYTFAFVALPLALLAGPADFTWHAKFGFENQIDSTYSPPHQGLFLAGALLAAIPLAAAWQRRGTSPSLRESWPALFSFSSSLAVVLFVIHQVVPFYSPHAMAAAWQRDLIGRVDAFPGGGAVHAEGLARAVEHFGDQAWPYYFYGTHMTMMGIMMFSIVAFGGVLLLRRRWQLPAGSQTLIFLWLALLLPLLSQYRQWQLAIPLVVTGIAGDIILNGLTNGAGPLRLGRIRIYAALMPVVLWSTYFVCVQLFKGGLGWGATLWFGVLTTNMAYCYLLSLLIFAPRVEEGEGVVVSDPAGVAIR